MKLTQIAARLRKTAADMEAQGKNLVLDRLGKLRTGIGFQVHGNVTSKHVNLLGLSLTKRRELQMDCLSSEDLKGRRPNSLCVTQ